MHETRVGARRERKDMLRNLERVQRAAHELFAERGLDVTMEEVARRAGVGVGTIYRRFPSKEHLFLAVSRAACADTHRCLLEAAQVECDPVGKLRALVVVHYHRIEHVAALLDARPDPLGQRGWPPGAEQHFYATLHSLLEEVIVEGQQAGLLRRGAPAVLAALCLELLNPRAFQNLQRVAGGGPEHVAEHVVAFLLNGLGTGPSPEGRPQPDFS